MTLIKTINSLKEALAIHPKDVISLVGAGGKTTLMFVLAKELSTDKGLVITTTTTKIFPPSLPESPYVLLSRKKEEIVDFILKNRSGLDHITIASEKLAGSNKLKGIKPELVKILIQLRPVTYVIIESDGAARRPLKAPDPLFEPVIPQNTSLVIPVVGIDALGCKLTEENVFRANIASKLTGISLGEAISEKAIVTLMLHPSGIMRGSPDQARIIPFINKIDMHPHLSEARDLASKILDSGHPRIDRVVLGQAQLNPPVVEVVFKR